MPLSRPSPQQRIKNGSAPDVTSGCWIWKESTNAKGYAHLRYAGRMYRANRFSWEAFYGKIPEELHVLHTCDNRLCVNPAHLFLGTNLDNVQDRMKKGRHITLRGSQHGMAKLTEYDVLSIRKSPISTKTLASHYNVTQRTIQFARSKHTWTHI